jgi:membrane associated rhomboid family serine protease
MFPFRDHNPSGITPHVTIALIVLNAVIFVYSHLILQGAAQDRFFLDWSFIPARFGILGDWLTLFSAMFLHGGWMHILGNMLFLWVFGDNLEARLGGRRYLAFYLACGLAAGLAQYAFDPEGAYPVVGASGAIAGVMGAYLWLYPKARVDVIFIFFIFFKTFPLRAWMVLGFWGAFQLWSGLSDPLMQDGVAYWEHIGGFAAGLAMALPLGRMEDRYRPSGLPRVLRK